MHSLSQRLSHAAALVRRAGDDALRLRGQLTVEHKSDNDYVTQVDRQTERAIFDRLAQLYPDDGFLGEEYGSTADRPSFWVLDPIDGTTNYIRAMEEFSVSLAYMEGGEPVLGVVYCPALGSLYTAVRGMGAFKNGEPIRVSSDPTLRDSVVGMSFAHRIPAIAPAMGRLIASLMASCGDMRRSGSAALDLCRVADGSYGAYVEPGLNLYDIAAGVVIVREAGGTVTGFPGEEHALVTGNTLAGSPVLHPLLEKLVRSAFTP